MKNILGNYLNTKNKKNLSEQMGVPKILSTSNPNIPKGPPISPTEGIPGNIALAQQVTPNIANTPPAPGTLRSTKAVDNLTSDVENVENPSAPATNAKVDKAIEEANEANKKAINAHRKADAIKNMLTMNNPNAEIQQNSVLNYYLNYLSEQYDDYDNINNDVDDAKKKTESADKKVKETNPDDERRNELYKKVNDLIKAAEHLDNSVEATKLGKHHKAIAHRQAANYLHPGELNHLRNSQ